MKKSLITTLIAAPLLTLSSMSFAAEPATAEPVLLSASQMDGVTAGTISSTDLIQLNIPPVTVVQISVLNGSGNNYADIISGALGYISR